jgi:hypothetical protein
MGTHGQDARATIWETLAEILSLEDQIDAIFMAWTAMVFSGNAKEA